MIAFLLRRYQLGAESLWFDEADIVAMARQPASVLLESFARAGENGPLYTLMLHFWLALHDSVPAVAGVMRILFGATYEAPIRGLSMLFGTAAIPVMYAFARRTGGVAVGLIAATLLTFNPFHLWYSQDAKMYSLLVFMTLLSSLLYVAALERNSVPLWIGYVVSAWVMLTVHSMAGLVLLAQLAATPFLVRGFRRTQTAPAPPVTRRRFAISPRWVRWGWAMLLILGPIFPIAWLRLAALVTGTVDTGNWYRSATLADILLTIFVKFAVNQSAPTPIAGGISIPWEAIGTIAIALLAFAGAWAMLRRPDEEESEYESTDPKSKIQSPKYLVFALWLVPILVFWVVTMFVSLFHPRYLIMALPSYLIAAAVGTVVLWRRNVALALVPVVLLAVSTGAALLSFNYSPETQKEDWRGAMVYVQDHIRLRDAVVVFPGYLNSAVKTYYTPGGPGLVPDRPVETIHSLLTENYGQREMEEDLRDIIQCQERVWLVVSPTRADQEDPQHKVLQWFQYNFYTFDTKVFNGVTVYGIAFNQVANCWYPNPDWVEPHKYENGLEFLGYIYELRDDDTTPTQPDASYLPLTLYWRIQNRLYTDYIINVKVTDSAGNVVKEEALPPQNGYWPTSNWPPNHQLMDYRDIRLPGNLPAGDYKVSVTVYPKDHPDQPLKLEDGSTEFSFQQPLKIVPWQDWVNGKR